MRTSEAVGMLAVIFGFGAVYEAAYNGGDAGILAGLALLAITVLLCIGLARLLRWYQEEEEKKKASSRMAVLEPAVSSTTQQQP